MLQLYVRQLYQSKTLRETQLLTSFSAPVYHHLVPAVISVAVAQTSLCKRFFDKLTKSLFLPPLKKTAFGSDPAHLRKAATHKSL